MNRQSQIKMTPEERHTYLTEKAKTMMLCTVDKDGFPLTNSKE